MGLHIDVLGTEELFGAIASEIFNNISELASAVIAFAGITFSILVGEDGTGCLKHRLADEVLGGDHLQPFVLTAGFILNGSGNLRIGPSERKSKRRRHA